jgi:hypothetical protein
MRAIEDVRLDSLLFSERESLDESLERERRRRRRNFLLFASFSTELLQKKRKKKAKRRRFVSLVVGDKKEKKKNFLFLPLFFVTHTHTHREIIFTYYTSFTDTIFSLSFSLSLYSPL